MGILFLVYGLVIGSFLNVVIYRIPAGLSVVKPPSSCGSCDSRIKPRHLVPVLSFVLLKGKCAYCREKISIRYPLVEGVNGLIYLLIYLKFGLNTEAVLLCLLSSVLLGVAMIDYDTTDVYFSVLIPGGVMTLFLLVYRYLIGADITPYILSGLAGMAFIYVVIVITRGGMGYGDIWILGLIGFTLGPLLSLVSFFLTSLIGGATAAALLIGKKKKAKEGIPFGPFLILGFFITLFIGQELLNSYLILFNF